MKSLSLTMIVKNESKKLARCLSSVKDLVNEMVIVDTGSEDDTKQIALSFNAKVFDYVWCYDFAAARNFSLQQSSSDWNLILDADEYLDSESYQEILEFIQGDYKIGRVKRIDQFLQEGETKQSQAFISRILPKGVKYSGRVHEQVISDLPRITTPITIHHDGYLLSDKSERNLKLLELELNQKPYDDYTLYQIAKQYRLLKQYNQADSYYHKSYSLIKNNSWYKPNLVVDYIYNIISCGNFENGLKLIRKEEQALRNYPDFHFVAGLFYMELISKDFAQYGHFFPQIEREFLTCIELGDTESYDSVIGAGTFLASYNLGVFYEVMGCIDKAKQYYEISANYHYNRALHRLKILER